MIIWNPWHGCRKLSPGCKNCYVYRRDAQFGKDSRIIMKTKNFTLPKKMNRNGEYKIKDTEIVYTCMTSDFFIEEADEWRVEAWRIIRERTKLKFYIITKRIDRFHVGLPVDWIDGYDNVTIRSTCENQKMADYRLPILLELPIKYREIIHEPMLEAVNIEEYLATGKIRNVICGGESGPDGRLCDYSWILDIRDQCAKHRVSFHFKQTGTLFKKGNKIYRIARQNQMPQAQKAGISFESNAERQVIIEEKQGRP